LSPICAEEQMEGAAVILALSIATIVPLTVIAFVFQN
jgi:hypothetical protein